jgi:hypothetical protein
VCTTVDRKKEVTQHHRLPIPRKIAWKFIAAARMTTSHFSIYKRPLNSNVQNETSMQPFSNAPEKSKCKLTTPCPEKFSTTNANPTLKSHVAESKERSQTSRRGGLKIPPDLRNRTKTSKNPFLHLSPAYICPPGRSLPWKP